MLTKKRILIMLFMALLLLTLVPGVVQAAPAKTKFTGEDQFLYDIYYGDEFITEDGIYQIRNGVSVARLTTTDPRVNGDYTFTFNADFEFRPEPVFVTGPMWGTFLLENEGGTWEGTYKGYRDELGYSYFKYECTGGGGYAGLAFKMFYKRLDPDPSVPASVRGKIFQVK